MALTVAQQRNDMQTLTRRITGRPPKGPTLMLGVRVPPEIHEAWRLAAQEDGQTLTDATIDAIKAALRQRELRRKTWEMDGTHA
jgi:predicted HicB family RNase H-like nuclease